MGRPGGDCKRQVVVVGVGRDGVEVYRGGGVLGHADSGVAGHRQGIDRGKDERLAGNATDAVVGVDGDAVIARAVEPQGRRAAAQGAGDQSGRGVDAQANGQAGGAVAEGAVVGIAEIARHIKADKAAVVAGLGGDGRTHWCVVHRGDIQGNHRRGDRPIGVGDRVGKGVVAVVVGNGGVGVGAIRIEHQAAVGGRARDCKAQGILIGVTGGGAQVDHRRGVLGQAHRGVGSHRQSVDRGEGKGLRGHATKVVAGTHGDAVVTGVADALGRGAAAQCAADHPGGGVDGQADRQARRAVAERSVVGIVEIAGDAQADAAVVVGRLGRDRNAGGRGVIHGRYRKGDGSGADGAVGVGDPVVEAVSAVVIAHRRVGVGAVGIQGEAAMGGLAGGDETQGVEVGVDRVVEQGTGVGGVFGQCHGGVACHRQGVDRRQGKDLRGAAAGWIGSGHGNEIAAARAAVAVAALGGGSTVQRATDHTGGGVERQAVGQGTDAVGQGRVVDVVEVARHIQADCAVIVGGDIGQRCAGRRAIVDRRHVEGQGRGGAGAIGIGHPVIEAVAAVVVGRRGIGVAAIGVEDQRAMGGLAGGDKGQGIEVGIAGVGQQRAGGDGVLCNGHRAVGGGRQCVERCQGKALDSDAAHAVAGTHLHGIDAMAAGALGRSAAVQRAADQARAGIDCQPRRQADCAVAQGVVVDVAERSGNIDGQRAVVVCGDGRHAAISHRRIVDRGDIKADGGDRRGAVGVHDPVGEAVGTVEIGCRGIGVNAVGVEGQRTVQRGTDQGGIDAQHIAIRVLGVGQQVAAHGRIFSHDHGAVVGGWRRVADREGKGLRRAGNTIAGGDDHAVDATRAAGAVAAAGRGAAGQGAADQAGAGVERQALGQSGDAVGERAVDIAEVARHVEAERGAVVAGLGADDAIGDWHIVDRVDGDRHGGGHRAAIGIDDPVGKAVAAVVVGRWGVKVGAVGVEGQHTVGRTDHGGGVQPQDIAVDVTGIGQQVAGGHGVFTEGQAAVDGGGCRVGHRQDKALGHCGAVAVIGSDYHAVGAVAIRATTRGAAAQGAGDLPSGVDAQACGQADGAEAQAVAVDIVEAIGDAEVEGGIVGAGLGADGPRRGGRIVDGDNGQAHGGRGGCAVGIGDGVGKAVAAVVVGGRGVGVKAGAAIEHQGAVAWAGRGGKRHHVIVGSEQGASHRHVLGSRVAAVGGHGRWVADVEGKALDHRGAIAVDGRDGNGVQAGVATARGAAVQIAGDHTGRVDTQTSRQTTGAVAQGVAVHIRKAVGHAEAEGRGVDAALCADAAHTHGSVIDRRDCKVDGGGGDAAVGIDHLVGKAVAAVVVGRWRIGVRPGYGVERQGAVAWLRHGAEGQAIAVDIVGRQGAGHCSVFRRGGGAVGGGGRRVDHIEVEHLRGQAAATIGGADGDRVRAVGAALGGAAAQGAGDEPGGAHGQPRGQPGGGVGQSVAVGITELPGNVEVHSGAVVADLSADHAAVDRRGVDRCDGQGNGGGGGAAVRVDDLILEGIGAMEAGVGGVDKGAIAVEHQDAVGGALYRRGTDAQGVAVWVGVVGQHVATDRAALGAAEGIGDACRSGVDDVEGKALADYAAFAVAGCDNDGVGTTGGCGRGVDAQVAADYTGASVDGHASRKAGSAVGQPVVVGVGKIAVHIDAHGLAVGASLIGDAGARRVGVGRGIDGNGDRRGLVGAVGFHGVGKSISACEPGGGGVDRVALGIDRHGAVQRVGKAVDHAALCGRGVLEGVIGQNVEAHGGIGLRGHVVVDDVSHRHDGDRQIDVDVENPAGQMPERQVDIERAVIVGAWCVDQAVERPVDGGGSTRKMQYGGAGTAAFGNGDAGGVGDAQQAQGHTNTQVHKVAIDVADRQVLPDDIGKDQWRVFSQQWQRRYLNGRQIDDGHHHHRNIPGGRGAVGVPDLVGNGVDAVVIGVRGIAQRAVVVDGHRAMLSGGARHSEGVAIGIDDRQGRCGDIDWCVFVARDLQAQQRDGCRVGDLDHQVAGGAGAGQVGGRDHDVIGAAGVEAIDRGMGIDLAADQAGQWVDRQARGQVGGGVAQHVEHVAVTERLGSGQRHCQLSIEQRYGAQVAIGHRHMIADHHVDRDGFSDAPRGHGVGKAVAAQIAQRRGVGDCAIEAQYHRAVGALGDTRDGGGALEGIVGQRQKGHGCQGAGLDVVGHAVVHGGDGQGDAGGLDGRDAITGLQADGGAAVVVGRGCKAQSVEGRVDGRRTARERHAGIGVAIAAGKGQAGGLLQGQVAVVGTQGHGENIVVLIAYGHRVAIGRREDLRGVFGDRHRRGCADDGCIVGQDGIDVNGGGFDGAVGGDCVGKAVAAQVAVGGRIDGIALGVDGHGAVQRGGKAGHYPAGILEGVVGQHVEGGRSVEGGRDIVVDDVGHRRDADRQGGVDVEDPAQQLAQANGDVQRAIVVGGRGVDQVVEGSVDVSRQSAQFQVRAQGVAGLGQRYPGVVAQVGDAQRAYPQGQGEVDGHCIAVDVADADLLAQQVGENQRGVFEQQRNRRQAQHR